MSESLKKAALDVLSYWDYLDSIKPTDLRATEEFENEMDRRMDVLRKTLEDEEKSNDNHTEVDQSQ